MSHPTCRLALLLVLILVSSVGALAESSDSFHFSVWGGANFTNGHVFGYTQNRRLVDAGFSWMPLLTAHRKFAVRYRIDAFPAVFLHDLRYAPSDQPQPPGSDWVYAAGLSPVGAELDLMPRSRVQPFFATTGGFLYFQRKVLAYSETQFQFTVCPAIGVRVRTSRKVGLEFGYRYRHISNANIYRANPGVDAQILYGGLTF